MSYLNNQANHAQQMLGLALATVMLTSLFAGTTYPVPRSGVAKTKGTSSSLPQPQTPALRANGKIAFSILVGIQVMNSDGSNQTTLTNASLSGHIEPAWSPDGARIAFIGNRGAYPYDTEIYVMNADGSNQINLTNNPGDETSPTWSPDGTRIAFTSQRVADVPLNTAFQLYVMNADGSNQVRLTQRNWGISQPSWSPDGSRIAFATLQGQELEDGSGAVPVPDEICVMNADGGNLRSLTNNPNFDDAPTWSPDGARIAFTRHTASLDQGQLHEFDIYVMNADGSNQIRLTNNTDGAFDPAWSPDGTSIAFASGYGPGDDNSAIYVMNADGSDQRRLTNNAPTHSFGPAWQSRPSTTFINPVDDPQFFVRQHYRDFLNREPDAEGLAFWSNEITLCGANQSCIDAKRINASAAFFLSIEFQETGYLAYRMYKSSYGNPFDAPVPITLSEFLPDTQKIGQGVIVNQAGWEQVLENNKQTFTTEFVQRTRFTSAYPTSMTPTYFVNKLFGSAGVTPSETDRAAVVNEFGSATNSADVAARSRALRRVADNSTLTQQEFNRAFVLMQYFGYLRRNPNDPPELTLDFQGYNFWLTKLTQFNGDYSGAEMVKAFIVSQEYRQRFGLP